MSRVYYNENEPHAAQWLRNLIHAGDLPAGDVDDRSIADVVPGDLAGYVSCHFFAGIGGWPLAARLAGWPDSRTIWTGSCPCQPFSEAGRQGGRDDPRHLWPDFHRLIRAARPPVIMGEQVAGALGYDWFDGVRADLAREDIASRVVDIPACAVDAPHERNRLYWIAVANAGHGDGRRQLAEQGSDRRDLLGAGTDPQAGYRSLANAERERLHGHGHGRADGTSGAAESPWPEWERLRPDHREHDADGYMADPAVAGSPWGDTGAVPGRAEPGRPTFESERRNGGFLADGESLGRWSGFDQARPFGDRTVIADWHGYVGDAAGAGQQGFTHAGGLPGYSSGRPDAERADGRDGGHGAVEHTTGFGWLEGVAGADVRERGRSAFARADARPNGSWWADHEWLLCHDGKSRRTQPGIPLLAPRLSTRVAAGSAAPPYHPSQERVGKWRGFGNAINVQLAKEVIAAFLDVEGAA